MDYDPKAFEMAKLFFNYSDEEAHTVMSSPKYRRMLEKAPQLMDTEFIFEIEEAHGCACQHRPGQTITINGDGALRRGGTDGKICIYLLNALTPIVYGAQEFIFAGLDPNELTFSKVGCFDNGVKCGGFGHVAVQFYTRRHCAECV